MLSHVSCRTIIAFGVCAVVTTTSLAAHAALVVQIDMRSIHSPGGNWNEIPDSAYNSTTSALTDFSTGLATAASYTGSGWTSWRQTSANWTAGTVDWVVDQAGDDMFVTNGTATSVIGGLSNSSTYQVEVVASFQNNTDVIGDYTIDGSFADTTYTGSTASLGDDWNSGTHGRVPGNWMIWNNVAPTGGAITVTAAHGTLGNVTGISAIRVSEIEAQTQPPASSGTPEPGTLLLAVLAMAAFVTVRPCCKR